MSVLLTKKMMKPKPNFEKADKVFEVNKFWISKDNYPDHIVAIKLMGYYDYLSEEQLNYLRGLIDLRRASISWGVWSKEEFRDLEYFDYMYMYLLRETDEEGYKDLFQIFEKRDMSMSYMNKIMSKAPKKIRERLYEFTKIFRDDFVF